MRSFLFVICLLTSHSQNEVTSAVDITSTTELSDQELKQLGFDFEVMLKLYLRDWHFLTETGNITDIGEVFVKENLLSAKEPLSDGDRCGRETSCKRVKGNDDLPSRIPNVKMQSSHDDVLVAKDTETDGKTSQFSHQKQLQATRFPKQGRQAPIQRKALDNHQQTYTKHRFPRDQQNINPQKSDMTIASDRIVMNDKNYHQDVTHLQKASGKNESHSADEEFHPSRHARDSSKVPVIYMPGDKKKRKCADVNGMLAGFNTFNYLTFVTGVITLILNINNNINNNNNNNNLNNNNDLSNNNVNSNTNTQNANQVVIFPPGRKRRSITDWVLQMLSLTQSESRLPRQEIVHKADNSHRQSTIATCMLSDMVFPLLEAFDAWTEGSTDKRGECGWKHYCEVQLKYSRRRDEVSAVLSQSLRWVSNLVSSPFSSSSECYFLIARCRQN